MEDLDTVITTVPLEMKRALAIRMIKQGIAMNIVCETLCVTASFVKKWRAIYNREGAKNISPDYKGRTGFLNKQALEEIKQYLKNKQSYRLEELILYIQEKYEITYKSKQSYYDILTSAGMSWKKTEKVNPKKDEALVLKKRAEIKKNSAVKRTIFSQETWSF